MDPDLDFESIAELRYFLLEHDKFMSSVTILLDDPSCKIWTAEAMYYLTEDEGH